MKMTQNKEGVHKITDFCITTLYTIGRSMNHITFRFLQQDRPESIYNRERPSKDN